MTTSLRIGLGEDTHRLADGGPLRVGGIDIPHEKHALGHSDADVLLHAITDAILGAAGLPDIGELFPDTNSENQGRDSADMLQRAHAQVRGGGFQVVNLDCVLHAQRPQLAPHKAEIRRRIATILSLAEQQINLKAKTGEGVGPVGNEEIIQARCVALLELIS